MGFYVYEECFDKWKGGLYGRYFDKNWESDVEAMVKRDRNRACIVIWGVGHGTQSPEVFPDGGKRRKYNENSTAPACDAAYPLPAAYAAGGRIGGAAISPRKTQCHSDRGWDAAASAGAGAGFSVRKSEDGTAAQGGNAHR